MEATTIDDVKRAIDYYEERGGPMDAPFYIDGKPMDRELPDYFHGTGGPNAVCTCDMADGIYMWTTRVRFVMDTGQTPEEVREDAEEEDIQETITDNWDDREQKRIETFREGSPNLN